MSSKSSKGPKQVTLPPPPPRSMQEIEADYGRFVSQAGQAQYQVYVYQAELQRLNENLRHLNMEAAARKELDAKTASKEVANV